MKKLIIVMLAICAAALVFYGIKSYRENAMLNQPGFANGNGRLEATEVTIATKLSGRIDAVYVDEGDFVKKGDKLALMQLNVLNAELAQAQAKLSQAQAQLAESQAQVGVKKSELAAAEATLKQKKSSFDGAKKRFDRAKELKKGKAISEQIYENDETNYLTHEAQLAAASAEVMQAKAALNAAIAETLGAQANIQAAKAQVARVQADIDDSLLVSPLDGRIQYRIAEAGEVLNAGGGVLNLVDLKDVYITFFLPEAVAGKVKIGADVRIVLDAIADTPIPAKISFVSSVAQFTPKTVETKIERQKLMFRVKAKIAPELLSAYMEYIKTGLPGVAWVQIDPAAKWPEFLKLKSERKQAAK
ncbi:MAG: HlyD family efflux transporter periplasmic adaptor subunit [Lentisphaerae bacterium]|nr:HlyD family efflux transporter periplasmic adaptor subunit [Lentisphaerota bacterium]